MSTSQIDDAILSVTGTRWTKVAMVIAGVAKVIRNDLPLDDESCQMIAGHIGRLVRDGQLLAQGDIENWRFSEIRRC